MNPDINILIKKAQNSTRRDLPLSIFFFLLAITSFALFLIYYVYGKTTLYEVLSFISLILLGFPAIFFLISFFQKKKEVASLKELSSEPFTTISGTVQSLKAFTLSKDKETLEITLKSGEIIYWWVKLGPCPFKENHGYLFTLKDNLVVKGLDI